MLKKIVHKVLKDRHFWRDIGFDELSELYVGTMARSLAGGVIGVFIPIYLYRLNYSVSAILMFYAMVYCWRLGWDFVAANFIARFGPKHSIITSYIFQIVAALMLTVQSTMHWPLVLLAFLFAASNSFFFIAYHVDFSKIKHSRHSGKELGYMNIMDQLGRALGPLLGGIVATVFGSPYLFLVAVCILIMGTWSLLKTAEPVRLNQRLDYRGLDLKPLKRDFFSYTAFQLEANVSIAVWPFFVSVFVLVGHVYLQIGLLTSLAVIMSVLASLTIGKLVDNKQGRSLLRISAVLNAILHVVRPFVGGFFAAAGVNLANETVTVGYKLPYFKGLYGRADSLEGYRIVYLSSIEAFSEVWRALFFVILAMIASFEPRFALATGFLMGAVFSLLMMTERFPVLNYERGVS